MAKKKNKPKGAYKKTKAAGDPWETDAEVIKILAELEDAVRAGLRDPDDYTKYKVLSPSATTGLQQVFGPKIYNRLHTAGASWEAEKGEAKKDGNGPLSAAFRLGQIAFILSDGDVVDAEVAKVAGEAVRKDEHCRRGGGKGDWCNP